MIALRKNISQLRLRALYIMLKAVEHGNPAIIDLLDKSFDYLFDGFIEGRQAMANYKKGYKDLKDDIERIEKLIL